MAAPEIIFSCSSSRIGLTEAITVTYSADMNMLQSEVRATKEGEPWGLGIGQLVHYASATPEHTERTFEIYDTHLVHGDGEYRISLYGQSADGSWNDNEAFFTSDGEAFMTEDGENFLVGR
ncbi:MAG: hypothetical protein FWF15_11355 [Oscillospiraceae bacterium]|nr:hypothetical protein [Oscillospiraceae bacterium]